MAYSFLAEGRDEQQLEELDVSLGMREDPAERALDELREHQEVMGMRFENPDERVPPMPGHADEEFG